MKSRIYKSLVVLAVAACFFDWPTPSNAVPVGPMVKSCSKATRSAERFVNKSTVEAEQFGNKAIKNPATGRAAYQGGRYVNQNSTSGTTGLLGICALCEGSGYFNGHACMRCNGTGRK